MSTFYAAAKESWLQGKNVSVDEMMIMNYGRSAETVRIRNKPIKSGFKMWALCDSGVSLVFFHIPTRGPGQIAAHLRGF